MFGQGCPLEELDLWLGVVELVEGGVVFDVPVAADAPSALVAGVLVALVELVGEVPCVLGAAAAPAMPAAAPPVASAPATMVAPRSLEMVMSGRTS